ncbi:MAG TPA: hypothetical protein VID19_06305 [Candidatus Eremiobacteraceae bacterium]|jgi:hypothetical protein
MRLFIIVLIATLAATQTPAAALDSSAAAHAGYTTSDIAQLVQAVIGIPKNHAFLMALEVSPASALPAWDSIAHYAGPQQLPDGRTAYFVLVNEQYAAAMHDVAHADHSVAMAIASAVMLSAMDGAIAGPKWKSLYDAAASADSLLGADAPDRYLNRHALANPLADTQTAVYASIGDAPIGDAGGNPLTEKLAYGPDPLGLARLGIGAARILELSEDATIMKQQAAQDFEDDWFASFGSLLTDDGRVKLDGLRPLLRPDSPAVHRADQDHFTSGILAIVNALPLASRAAFSVGLQASEIRYNATVIRHADEDTALRTGLTGSTALDGTFPDLAGLRARLAAVSSGDWATIASLSDQIIHRIIDGK